MAPKQKVQNSSNNGNLAKKRFQMKTDDSFSLKDKVYDTEKNIAGKKDGDSKKQFSSPELVDEKENMNKTELPNFELNL